MPVRADDDIDRRENLTTQSLKKIDDALVDAETKKRNIAENVVRLQTQAEAISSKLVTIARKISAYEAKLTADEANLKTLDRREGLLVADLAARRQGMAELLAGLQRLERNPPPVLAAHPGDAIAAIRGATLFGSIVPELERQSNALVQALAQLNLVRAQQSGQRGEIDQNLLHLQQAHKELTKLHLHKQTLLIKMRGSFESQSRQTTLLVQKAGNLRELLAGLAKERLRRKAELDEEKQRQLVVLHRPKMAFTQARTRLEYPVQGQKIRQYGDKDGFGGRTKGDFLATRKSAQVIAPADAVIEYAGDFRSYGQLLILDVGEGYHVLLAGLDLITIKTGQHVRAGEPIGRMGRDPARGTLIGDRLDEQRPILYIEFRRNGSAIDPDPWWIGSHREARR